MSVETLRQFQRAARIKDAFFPTNGNVRSISLSITPPVLPSDGPDRKIGDQRPCRGDLRSAEPGAGGGAVAGAGGKTAVSLSEQPEFGQQQSQPSEISGGTGQWAFFRLLDKASKSTRTNGISASWIVGGREVPFQIGTGTVFNPLHLPALSEFKCPASL